MTGVLLAHGGAAGGPNFEALVLAIPMVVVGVILFVQKSAKPIVSVLLVLGGIALMLGGFTFLSADDDHDDGEAASADGTFATTVEQLCDARASVADGYPAAADHAFDDAHPALHTLALELTDEDRQAAAELLAAKQRVEADLAASAPVDPDEDPPSVGSMEENFDRLIAATTAGAAVLGEEMSSCD